MGKELHVELKVPLQGSLRGSRIHDMAAPRAERNVKLEITGIPENTKEEHLNLYFEATKHSGGGPIEDMDFDSETGTAIITFKDNEGTTDIMHL